MIILGDRAVSFPPPYQTIIWLNDLSHSSEATSTQHSSGRVGLWEGVGSNGPHLGAAESVADQRLGSFRRVTFALMLWSYTVSNFNHTVRFRWALETALADHSATDSIHQHKTMDPRINRTGAL